MADNVSIRDSAGAAQTVATDDVSGVNYQVVKVADGRDQGTAPLAVRTDPPGAADGGAVVRQAPVDVTVCSFAQVGSSLLSPDFTQRRLGTGMGVTQGNGNLLVTTGTTANSEFLARTVKSFNGALIARAQVTLSQRIANNNFAVILADRIGEGLSCTINSATSISVTLTAHGFTAENIGQFMFVGGISGANGVPGRYAILSIPDANTINFTVASWPASGSCTLDLFGWNHYRIVYSGTTATAATFDAQRRGWQSGDTTLTINTTATGHILQISNDGRNGYVADALAASATAPTVTTRASRFANIPDPDVELFVYLWAYNGTTNPASTTTWTVGFVSVEDTTNNVVYLGGVRQLGQAAALPVAQQGTVTATVSGTVTANIGTGALAAGTNAIGDVGVQYRANATGAATLTNINCPATPAAQQLKGSAGRLLGLVLTNTAASARYVKIFNALAASVTPGTTSALTEIAIPQNGILEWHSEGGAAFSTGITIMITGGQGLTNNTAVTASDVVGFSLHA